MLSKEKRLNLKKDFKWVAFGQKLGNDLIRLYIRQGDNLEPKVGIAGSKADFKKAIDRNRARRLVSTGFESLYNQLPKNINIVVLPRQGVLELTSAEVTKALGDLLKKGGIASSKTPRNDVIASGAKQSLK